MRKLSISIGAVAGLLLPSSVAAVASIGDIDPCPVDGLSCETNFVGYVLGILGLGSGTFGVTRAFIGVLAAMLIYYGIKLILNAENDSTTSEVKLAYGHAITGAIVVGAAGLLAETFTTMTGTNVLIAPEPTIGALQNVIISFKGIIYAALIFNLSFQGIRLVMHQDESQSEKAKKQFLYGIMGAVIAILADAIVSAFWGPDVAIISTQTIGIINFLLTILGTLAVISIFIAGIFLVLSVDESLKDRAKKSILASIVVLAVVILSLSILMIFVEAPLA